MTETEFCLGVITGRDAPNLSEDAHRLTAALADRGFQTDPVRWDDPSIQWEAYDGVLFRSCWEYPTDVERFNTLLAEVAHADIPVCNPLSVIRWNMHKSYLVELADAGVRLPPTTVIDAGTDIALADVLDRRDWDQAVVKPAIGGFSRDVPRISRRDLNDTARQFQSLLDAGDVVVQRFVPEITTGERSIVFFDGTYSHAWNSRTTDDDITAFDGIDAGYEPPAPIREQAAGVLDAARDVLGDDVESLPYARVDYVHRDGELL
jgi:glutathione synthase/RimK-type ligase-like ATP-grasp enzyme